jgi:hypothetical protein
MFEFHIIKNLNCSFNLYALHMKKFKVFVIEEFILFVNSAMLGHVANITCFLSRKVVLNQSYNQHCVRVAIVV